MTNGMTMEGEMITLLQSFVRPCFAIRGWFYPSLHFTSWALKLLPST
jgi:hypothetical protein